MIMRQSADGWAEFFRTQADTVPFFRCKIPKGLTSADVDKIRDHLLKLAAEKKFGPS